MCLARVNTVWAGDIGVSLNFVGIDTFMNKEPKIPFQKNHLFPKIFISKLTGNSFLSLQVIQLKTATFIDIKNCK